MLIISDRASNVNRIMRIIQRMDESGDEPIEVIPLHNASAADVVRIVNSLNQGQGAEGGGAAVKIVADERTNSILLTGEKSQRLRLKALILNMDTPLPPAETPRSATCAMPTRKRSPTSSKARPPPPPRRRAARPPGAPGGGASNVDASVTIWADVATNALIITAPPKIMKSLMAVIDKLDIRRAQVQVEALIVEVDVNKSSNLGVQWLLFGQGKHTVPAGIINLPGAGTSIVDLAAACLSGGTATRTTGLATPISSSTVGTGATVAVGRVVNNGTSFAALVQALRSDGSSNIISTPSLITMNNEEAEVKVTQEIPLITGSYTSSTASVIGTTSPFTTIQREEVGTILKVTPHINEGNSVQLKIEQEDSSPGAKLTDSADISTNKRSIKTTVLIEDGGIIVLGGLMSDTVHGERGPRARSGRDPAARQSVQVAQRLAPEKEPVGVHPAEDTARRGGHREHQRSEIQRLREQQKNLEQRANHLAAGPEAAGRAGDAAGVGPAGAIAVGREPAGRHAQYAAARNRRRRRRSRPPLPPPASTPPPSPPRRPRPTHERRTQRSADQRKLSFPFAKRHGVLVRGIADGVADTVCRPGVTPQSLAEVRRFVGVPLKLERVSVESFDSMLRVAYEAGSGAAMQMLEGLDDNTDLAHLAEDIPESSDLLESDDEAPIIRLINALLTQAVKENASDIHIEPYENRLVIRFRVDGVLREVLQTKRAVAPLVVSRIKVMSKLDIAERRLPQDGRISLRIAGRAVDVRVSTLPSGHGERVVLRLLDKQAGRIELTSLGDGPAHPGHHG